MNSISNSEYSIPIRINLSVSPPPTPENGVITTGTQNSLTYAWNSVEEATSYNIYRASTENGIYSKVGNAIVDIPYTDMDLQSGTRYYYKVTSVTNILDEGTPINLESGKSIACSGITIPSNPIGLSITNRTGSTITISCPAVKGADYYKIYKREGASDGFTEVETGNIQVFGITFTVNELSPNTEYTFKMTANNTTGASGYSSGIPTNTTTIPLNPPTGITITNITDTSLILAWNDVLGKKSYNIYKSTNPSSLNELYINTTESRELITGLNSGTIYYFWVSTINDSNENGPKSDRKSALTKPSVPSNLQIQSINPTNSTLKISWNSVNSANNYKIYRSLYPNGEFPYLNETQNLFFIDEGLNEDTTYYYKVTALNDSGESGKSATISEKTSIFIPDKPIVTINEVTVYYVSLDWNDVPGVDHYEVYRNSTLIEPNCRVSHYDDDDVSIGQLYGYSVVAVSATGQKSPPSTTIEKKIPILTISSPSGGTYTTGSTVPIRWSIEGEKSSTVEIYYYKGSNGTQIISNTSNNGAYDWTIPSGLVASTDYTILVRDKGTKASDHSNNFSIIIPATYNLSTPSASTTDRKLNIRWTKSGTCGSSVRLDLYRGSTPVKTIASSTSNDGSYDDWAIPNDLTTTTTYKVKVTDLTYGAYDYSNSFEIIDVHDGTHTIDIGILDNGEIYKKTTTSDKLWISSDENTEKFKFSLPGNFWGTKWDVSIEIYNMYGVGSDSADLDLYLYKGSSTSAEKWSNAFGENVYENIRTNLEENTTYTVLVDHYSGDATQFSIWIENCGGK